MFRKFVLFVLLITLCACGSSVTDIDKDSGKTQDILFTDYVAKPDISEEVDAVTDIYSSDGALCDFGNVSDGESTDTTEGDEIAVDGETEDIENDAISEQDAVSEDIVEKDIVEDDIITDVFADTSEDGIIVDAGQDIGTDVSEDVGSLYCSLGDKKQYQCPEGLVLDYCICENKGCKPHCDKIGTESEGWYDCNGKLIKWASCAKCKVYCDALGSKSEGWYSDCDGLIKYDQCAPDWFCLENPEARCGYPCTDSCDCPEERPFCINGHCDKTVPISCSNDNMCPCGYYCLKTYCVMGKEKCKTSCDCPEGFICVNNVCKEKTNNSCTNEPCPCNFYCAKSPFGVDTCQKGCFDNCDCPINAPICSGGFCLSELIFDCKGDDRNCPCGQRCVNGKCVKSDEYCDNSCECLNPLRQVCINGVCTDEIVGCNNDSECPCGMSCIKGNCYSLPGCKDSCDCGEEEICRNSKCTPYDPNSGCKTDLDCPCKRVCVNGGCIVEEPLPCTYSCDCPKNMICPDGVCKQYIGIKICKKDNECPCGNYCDLSIGIEGECVVGCNDPCDCPPETPYCFKGQCQGDVLPISCKEDKDCKCQEVCRSGRCIPF